MKSAIKYLFIRSLCSVLLIVFSSLVSAGTWDDTIDTTRSIPVAVQKNYILKLDSLINIKVNLNNYVESFEQRAGDQHYDIQPNIAWLNKVSLNYRFVSGAFTFKLPYFTENDDDDRKGSTKAFGLSFNFNIDKIHLNIHGSKTKGYYLANTGDFISNWDPVNDPYLQIPELRNFKLGGSTYYRFNKNFSLKALDSQTEIQLKSCGSFMLGLLYDYQLIDNTTFDGYTTSGQKSNVYDAIVVASYLYTFVLHSRWYAAGGISAGPGIYFTNLRTYESGETYKSNYNNFATYIAMRGGVGYNSKRFISGMEFNFSITERDENTSSVQTDYNTNFVQFFVGYRFGAPKFISKTAEGVENTFPFLK